MYSGAAAAHTRPPTSMATDIEEVVAMAVRTTEPTAAAGWKTMEFSDSTVVKFDPGYVNPYDIQLRTADLRGPDGPLELDIVLPPGEPVGGVLRYTLIAVPVEPLAPGATYTFEAEVSWGDARKKKVRTEFHTAKTPDFRTTYLDQLEDVSRVPQGRVLHGPSGLLR